MASKNLKQLDVQNLYLLNMPSKLLLAGLLIVGMLALGYVGVFKDQIETLNTQEAKEDELKETFTRKSIQAASLNNLKAELASIRSAFDVFVETIADRRGNPNLIQELHQAGSTNGLRLDSVAPLQPENDGPIQKLPYQISITGKYSQISQFTRDVGDLSRIITLDSLKLVNAGEDKEGKGNKGELTLSAIATTYKARPAEEIAAELAAQQAQEEGKSTENEQK